MAGSLRLSGNQFHIAGPATEKKPADHNCWDDGEARREDLGWHSEDDEAILDTGHW